MVTSLASRSGSRTGNGRNSNASTALKITVLAAIPSVRRLITPVVNSGFLASRRAAKRRSGNMPFILPPA